MKPEAAPRGARKNRPRTENPCAWLIFLLLAVALMGFGRMGIALPLALGKISLCLGTILLGTEIAFALMHFRDQGWVRNTFFCAIFILGLATYLELAADRGDPWQVLLAGCKSLASFFPSRGEYELKGGESYWIRLLYVVFHILVYVFFAYFALSFWGARVYNRMLNFWTLDKNKCVFWCDTISENDNISEKMLLLAGSIKEEEGRLRIVFSISEEKNQEKDYFLFREMNRLGYVLKQREHGEIHSDCLKAGKHFFLTEDFNWNIRQAQALLAERAAENISSPADLYIMVSDSSEENDYYNSWADHIHAKSAVDPEKYGQLEIHLVNESELIARKFIESWPMLKCPGIEIDPVTATVRGNFRILLLGLGNHGEAILRNMIEDGQFVQSPRGTGEDPDFKVDIFDRAPGRLEYFFKRYPDANRYCRMDPGRLEENQLDVFSAKFHDFLTEHIADYNRIVICLGGDRLNIEAAARLERIAKTKRGLPEGFLEGRLFVLLEQNNALFDELKENDTAITGCLDKSGVPGKMQMTVFGSPEEIFTYTDIAEKDGVVELGKLVNSVWLGKSAGTLRRPLKWEVSATDGPEIVSYFNRQSSVASAKGFRNIALLLKPELLSLKTDLSVSEVIGDVPDEVPGELLETIAETEHLRWNAFHFMRGIRCWPVDEVTDEEKEAAGNKPKDIKNHFRHAALVPFAELYKVNKRFGLEEGKMENNDRGIVKTLLDVRTLWKDLLVEETSR